MADQEHENDKKDMGFSYDFPKEDKDKKIKINLDIDPTAYNRLKEEKEALEGVLDSLALAEFEKKRNELLKIASAEDRAEIEVLDSPSQLEFYRGKYASRLESPPFPPETPGFATTREHASSLGLQDTFESPKAMGEYYLAMSQERDPNGRMTPRATEARKRLNQLGKKFWDSLANAKTVTKIEVPIQPIMRNPVKPNEFFPHVVEKGQKSEHASSTEHIPKGGR